MNRSEPPGGKHDCSTWTAADHLDRATGALNTAEDCAAAQRYDRAGAFAALATAHFAAAAALKTPAPGRWPAPDERAAGRLPGAGPARPAMTYLWGPAVAFLAARLADDEAVAKTAGVGELHRDAHVARHDPDRVLREVAAKRARLERYLAAAAKAERFPNGANVMVRDALLTEVREDAIVYADHPEWTP